MLTCLRGASFFETQYSNSRNVVVIAVVFIVVVIPIWCSSLTSYQWVCLCGCVTANVRVVVSVTSCTWSQYPANYVVNSMANERGMYWDLFNCSVKLVKFGEVSTLLIPTMLRQCNVSVLGRNACMLWHRCAVLLLQMWQLAGSPECAYAYVWTHVESVLDVDQWVCVQNRFTIGKIWWSLNSDQQRINRQNKFS